MSRILKASFAAVLAGALILPIGLGQQSDSWPHAALSTIFRTAWANEISTPEETIKNAIIELRRAANDEQKRASAADTIHGILLPRFNTRIITRRVLGKHWKQASEYQQKEFERLFIQYICGFYARQGLLDAFQDDSGVTVTFGQTVVEGNSALVRMNIREWGGTYRVGFVMHTYDGVWKVVDIRMENFSVIATKRSEFGPHISQRGLGPIIDYLRKEVRQYYQLAALPS
jgi:phospholipid transport system substrate-binding protein